MESTVKCHKCRNVLLDDINKQTVNKSLCVPQLCSSFDRKQFIYIAEDFIPNWIKCKIEEEQWMKGKLHCETCGNRVGAFDFISGRKCDCGVSILPPVYFISSQVDRPIKISL